MPSMGRPRSWVFWVAGAYALAMALVGFGVTMRASDTNGVFWGACLLLFAAVMGLGLAFYALRSLPSLRQPPGPGPDAEGP
jgi:hypothetical protein